MNRHCFTCQRFGHLSKQCRNARTKQVVIFVKEIRITIKSTVSTDKALSFYMRNIYIFTYMRACMYIACLVVLKGQICERKFAIVVCRVVISQRWFVKWIQIHSLDVTKYKLNILFVDRLNVKVFRKNSFFF